MTGILGKDTFVVSCIFYFLDTDDTNTARSHKTDAEDKPKESNKKST